MKMHSLQAYAFGFHLLTTTKKLTSTQNIKKESHVTVEFTSKNHIIQNFNETGNLHGNDCNVNGKYER